MTDLLAYTVLALYGAVLCLLLPFAGHRTHLWRLSRRGGPHRLRAWPGPLPRVTVQLPIFNEKHVVERLIDAACALDYPRALLEIQVLDDSDDETALLASRRVAHWRGLGVDVSLQRRPDRAGYKAGALARGLDSAKGDFFLILDADFVPGSSLLRDLLPAFAEPDVGMVQARWDHINESSGWLTRAQALLLDGHFFFEQCGRYRGGRFFNFNGTAGMWRKEALVSAGGWQFDTLTEDLDVSYRAQMAGWRFVFREDIGVRAELPRSVDALLVQQRRWAQGGIQTARKILPSLLRGPFPLTVKLEAVVHLCGHLAHPLTLSLGVLILPAALARRWLGLDELWWLDLVLFAAATGPFLFFYFAAARKRARAGAVFGVLSTIALGVGMSVFLSRVVLRGLRRTVDPFERTPKLGSEESSNYERSSAGRAERWVAVGLGSFMVAQILGAAWFGFWASIPFIGLFAFGYLRLGVGSFAALPVCYLPEGGNEQHPPNGEPHRSSGPTWLWPGAGGLVGTQPPVAEEYEPA